MPGARPLCAAPQAPSTCSAKRAVSVSTSLITRMGLQSLAVTCWSAGRGKCRALWQFPAPICPSLVSSCLIFSGRSLRLAIDDRSPPGLEGVPNLAHNQPKHCKRQKIFEFIYIQYPNKTDNFNPNVISGASWLSSSPYHLRLDQTSLQYSKFCNCSGQKGQHIHS